MKKTLVAAALAAFFFTSCSNQSQDATATADNHGHHDGMAHGDATPAAGTVVVETPDYTSVEGPVKEHISAVLDGYLTLKDKLVASDAAQVQAEAKALLATAEKVDLAGLEGEQKSFAEEKLSAVKQGASKIAEASDLQAQRADLEALSEATFALTKAFGANDGALYYQHCPMALNDKGGYWLSANQEIRNPYFGESMLKCGTNEEVLN